MKKKCEFFIKSWGQCRLFFVLCFFCSLASKAQNAQNKLWDKTFGGSDVNYFSGLQQTSDGGYILGGYSNSGISGDKTQPSRGYGDFWVIKVDASGIKTWDKTFGGSGGEVLSSVQQTSDGGYILGGGSGSGINGDKSQPSQGSDDYWVVKLDANGNKLWDKTFGGIGMDWIYCLKQTSDGGYILGGSSQSGISGDKSQASQGASDYWIIKLDANGNKLWDKAYGGIKDDFLSSLQQTSDGGYIVGGLSESGISSDKSQACQGLDDYWVLKLDANGNKLWDKTFGGSNADLFFSLQQTSDGGYMLGGQSGSGISGDKSQPSQGASDYWVIKLDVNGTKLWDRVFGGLGIDALESLKQTTDGGYILGGSSNSGISGDKSQPSQGQWDYWVVKIDAIGNKQWDKTFGGSGDEELTSLEQTTDGSYILGGYSYSGISGDKSQASRGIVDYWVVKLAAGITGSKEAETSVAVSIYPNPSQDKFKLQLSGLNVAIIEVIVSDLIGRTILQQQLRVTNGLISKELELTGSKGIYLLQLKIGEKTIVRNVMLD